MTTAKKSTTRRGPGPEALLKRYAVDKLKRSGLVWWRNQVGVFRIGYGKSTRMMHVGTPGLADLCVIGNDSRVWFIELKSPKGKIRPEQKIFMAMVSAGGKDQTGMEHLQATRGFFARTPADIDAIVLAAQTGCYIDESEYME